MIDERNPDYMRTHFRVPLKANKTERRFMSNVDIGMQGLPVVDIATVGKIMDDINHPLYHYGTPDGEIRIYKNEVYGIVYELAIEEDGPAYIEFKVDPRDHYYEPDYDLNWYCEPWILYAKHEPLEGGFGKGRMPKKQVPVMLIGFKLYRGKG